MMTVGELRKIIADLPDWAPVVDVRSDGTESPSFQVWHQEVLQVETFE